MEPDPALLNNLDLLLDMDLLEDDDLVPLLANTKPEDLV
jgi:hypothetical protein